jgi:hypothetical protein
VVARVSHSLKSMATPRSCIELPGRAVGGEHDEAGASYTE